MGERTLLRPTCLVLAKRFRQVLDDFHRSRRATGESPAQRLLGLQGAARVRFGLHRGCGRRRNRLDLGERLEIRSVECVDASYPVSQHGGGEERIKGVLR